MLVNKRFLLCVVLPMVLLTIFIVSKFPENKPKYDALNNPIIKQIQQEQGRRIENLEALILNLQAELSAKSYKDSIIQLKGQKDIESLKTFIKSSKLNNEKKHNLNDNNDIDQSFNILTNNIKARKK